MVQDEDSGYPGCDICQHPASMLFDEGVYLCTTHLAEARCLNQEGARIEWSLTVEGQAALATQAPAELSPSPGEGARGTGRGGRGVRALQEAACPAS